MKRKVLRPLDRRAVRDFLLGPAEESATKQPGRGRLLASALGLDYIESPDGKRIRLVNRHGEKILESTPGQVNEFCLERYLAASEENFYRPAPRILTVDGRKFLRVQDEGAGLVALWATEAGEKNRAIGAVAEIRDYAMPETAEEALALVGHLANCPCRPIMALAAIVAVLSKELKISSELWLS